MKPDFLANAKEHDYMADKIEHELAEGMEEDLGIKAMAAKLAPRGIPQALNSPYAPLRQGDTIEQKLQQIEQLVREIRATSAQVKGLLG